ncbi:MAG: hypothetical protein MMC23_004461 [Stictis urceolatum]|nr:hypothetical protein [Stictis urceolata]
MFQDGCLYYGLLGRGFGRDIRVHFLPRGPPASYPRRMYSSTEHRAIRQPRSRETTGPGVTSFELSVVRGFIQVSQSGTPGKSDEDIVHERNPLAEGAVPAQTTEASSVGGLSSGDSQDNISVSDTDGHFEVDDDYEPGSDTDGHFELDDDHEPGSDANAPGSVLETS